MFATTHRRQQETKEMSTAISQGKGEEEESPFLNKDVFCLVVVLDSVPRLTETYPALSSSAPKTEDE